MPKKLVCTGPKTIEWISYKDGEVPPGHIRLKSLFSAAKHGTEMASYKGYGNCRGPYSPELNVFLESKTANAYPAMVGNMVVGQVVEVGQGVTNFEKGDRALTYGCFSETHTTNAAEYCWNVPKQVAWQDAVCLDPAFFAFAAVRDGHVRAGDAVAVFGLGAIGLEAVQIAKKIAGASLVIALDPLKIRRDAAQALGADLVLDPSRCDAGLEIKKATGGRGVDEVIEYSGHWKALQASLRGVAFGGNVVTGAYPPPYDAGLDLGAEAHRNVPNIIFTRGCSQPNREHPRWDMKRLYGACWQFILDGRLAGADIVTPVVAFDDLMKEYPHIADAPETNIKLGVNHSK